MKNKIFIITLFFEVAIIIGIIIFLYIHRRTVLQINPVNNFSIQKTEDTQFQYYYEFPSNFIDYGKASWFPHAVTYRYNNDGLHERFDYEFKKASHIYRIITLGDSFTFGMWVNTEDNFSERLEDLLNTSLRCQGIEKFEVINLGAPGFDMQYSLKRFENKGMKYAPDFVIWFLRGENFILNTEKYRIREEYYKNQLQKADMARKYSVNSSDPYAASTLSYKEYMDAYNALSKEEQEKIVQSELSSITTLIREYHMPLLLLTWTEESMINKNRMKQFTYVHDAIWFDEVSDVKTFHPNDYHPNEEGHRHIAEESLRFLLSHVITSCQNK